MPQSRDRSGDGINPDTHTPDADDTDHRLLRVLQHFGVAALTGSGVVTYALFIAVASTAAPELLAAQPLWLTLVVQTGVAIPAVVAFALLAHYVSGVVAGRGRVPTWRVACYAAGVGAVVLPVFNYAMTSAAGQL